MVFIADRKELRTYDPERGYELFQLSGSSDGTLSFRLVGPDLETKFVGKLNEDPLTDDELSSLGPDYKMTPLVWTLRAYDQNWKSIIREAMTAYVYAHGTPLPNREAFVRFGSKGSIFDD